MSKYIVEKTIRINAEPDRVWDALTDPEKTKKYFFYSEVLSDWHPGSSIVFKGKMFFIIPFEMKGMILGIEKGKFLQYTLKNGKGDNVAGHSTVTDRLIYDNGQTILSITDDVGDGPGAEKRFERSQKGWDKILAGLKREAEKKDV